MQVLLAILSISLFSCVTIEKALSKISNTEHIFSAKSLKQGQLPGSPLVAGLVTLQLFQNAFPEFPWNFPYVFPCLVLCCNASLTKNSVGTDVTCNLTRHCDLIPVRIKLSVLLRHFSFDTYFLLNCCTWLNVTSLLPQCTSNVARKSITECMLATKIKNKLMLWSQCTAVLA